VGLSLPSKGAKLIERAAHDALEPLHLLESLLLPGAGLGDAALQRSGRRDLVARGHRLCLALQEDGRRARTARRQHRRQDCRDW